jgi:hypothetical protein
MCWRWGGARLLWLLSVLIYQVLAWPNGAGSCETARGGHYEQNKGTGGFEVAAKVGEAGTKGTLLTLTLGTKNQQFKGYVLRTTMGMFVHMKDEMKPMECFRPGDPFNGPSNSSITHTSRRLKGPMELVVHIPENACKDQPPAACVGHLQVLVLEDMGSWFKFYQTFTLTMKGGVELSASITKGRAEHPPRAEL